MCSALSSTMLDGLSYPSARKADLGTTELRRHNTFHTMTGPPVSLCACPPPKPYSTEREATGGVVLDERSTALIPHRGDSMKVLDDSSGGAAMTVVIP